MFFSTTILSTIGYGTFAPSADEAKWVLISLTVPIIAFFGVSIVTVSNILIAAIEAVVDKLQGRAGRPELLPEVERQTKTIAIVMRVYNTRPEGTKGVTKNAIQGVADDLFRAVGLEGWPEENHWRGIFAVILSEMFDAHDTDRSGDLDLCEAVSFSLSTASQMISRVQAKESRRRTAVTLVASMIILLLGAAVFYALEPDWTMTDSLYFTIITLTTVGLGDFAPTNRASTLFWFIHIVLGLGLLAAAGNAYQDVAQALSEIARREAEAAEKSVAKHISKKMSMTATSSAAQVVPLANTESHLNGPHSTHAKDAKTGKGKEATV